MASNMSNMNYAQDYQKALAQAYPYVLYFAKLYNTENDTRYKWVNGKTIQIPILEVNGRRPNDRDSISEAARNYNNAWEAKVLTNERAWSTLVHPEDINETNYVATIENITKVMNEEQKFPEKDRYLVSKLYSDYTATGKEALTVGTDGDYASITAENVLTVFDEQMAAMTNARVPAQGRVLYLTTDMNRLLKSAVTRYTANGDENVKRIVSMLDEVEIVVVPLDIMYTQFDFRLGSVVADGAKKVHWLLAHPSAVITPEKYSFASITEPSAITQGKYFYYEESHEDVFLLNKRADGVQFLVEK